jgi:hypothetical protein
MGKINPEEKLNFTIEALKRGEHGPEPAARFTAHGTRAELGAAATKQLRGIRWRVIEAKPLIEAPTGPCVLQPTH